MAVPSCRGSMTNRGRIQKHRRTDRDGDLVMDAPTKSRVPRPKHARTRKENPPKAQADSDTPSTLQLLQNVLNRRYNPETKLLDLSALATDPELQQVGMFDAKNTQSKFFPALMKVCDDQLPSAQQKRESVLSVSLARNNLPNISIVTTLAQSFPDLKNLDLSSNNFRNITSLVGWKHRFRNLDLLVMDPSPFQESEPGWETKIVEWYPRLRTLNGVQVRTDEQITISELARSTGLTEEYAEQCLDASQWDLEKASSTFDAYKTTLPAEAFATPARSNKSPPTESQGNRAKQNKDRSRRSQSTQNLTDTQIERSQPQRGRQNERRADHRGGRSQYYNGHPQGSDRQPQSNGQAERQYDVRMDTREERQPHRDGRRTTNYRGRGQNWRSRHN